MCMQAVTPSSVPVTLGMLARARPTGKRTESIQDNGYLPLWRPRSGWGQSGEDKVENPGFMTEQRATTWWSWETRKLHTHEQTQVDDVVLVFVCACIFLSSVLFLFTLLHSSLRMRAAHIKSGGGRRGTPLVLDGSHKSFVLVKSKREIFVRVQSRCGSKQQAVSKVMFQIPATPTCGKQPAKITPACEWLFS